MQSCPIFISSTNPQYNIIYDIIILEYIENNKDYKKYYMIGILTTFFSHLKMEK